uniref:Peptidase A2 domain-containing protein n=1 Tax=Panagrolaimus sp. ES5 TaxID=591445 RepID=A0AC34GJC2_9BILA
FYGIIDSGSAITVISNEVAQRVCKFIRPPETNGRATNGTTVIFRGETDIELQISTTIISTTAAVAEQGHCPVDIIIGYDIFRKLDASVNFKTKSVSLEGKTIPIYHLLDDNQQKDTVTTNKVILPEKTDILKGDNFLFGFSTIPMEENSTWLTTQTPKFKENHLAVGATLCMGGKGQKVPLRIYNNTNSTITLGPGSIVAEMELIQDESKSINLLVEDQEYIPEEADISAELPRFPDP